jgi:23S rRNA (adenine2503-C2)-methyltransferase
LQTPSAAKPDLKGLTLTELEALFAELGEPRYRAGQVASWVFARGVSSFDEMTDLPKGLRATLAERAAIGISAVVGSQRSAIDGTEKLLLEYPDGARIEAVILRDEDRLTGCISAQVGCRFGCAFCATGSMGFIRDLSAGEIVEEIMALGRQSAPERIGNLVFMGMGEPLDNYETTLQAVRIANAPWGLGIGARRITISTAGHVPGILRLAEEPLQIGLAVSLNAASQETRAAIMPIARQFPLAELRSALERYARTTGRMFTLEYVLLRNVNDSLEAARALAEFARELPCKINLICYNEIGSAAYAPPADQTVRRFLAHLRASCPTVVRRISRGSDISAGCGQLCVSRDRTG